MDQNPLIKINPKPTNQPYSTRKQQETKEERRRKRERWQSVEAKGRKIDEMRERESCAPESL